MTQSKTKQPAPRYKGLPENVTFHNLIGRNKRRSVLLMIGMGFLVVLVGTVLVTAIGLWTGAGADLNTLIPLIILGAVISIGVAVLSALWGFYGGSKIVLRIAGAVKIPKEADPMLYNVVEELSIAAGIPMPEVYLIDDTAINAFATGRDPDHAAVAITKGLRAKLTRSELAGVMAHEISHIRHFDIRLAMLMATMVGLIVLACDVFWHFVRYQFWFGGGHRSSRRSSSREGGGQAQLILAVVVIVLAILLAILAPTMAMLIRMAMSRQREYLADVGAVELTRDPAGMISALQKLGSCKEPLEVANRATAHMYIVNPLRNAMKGQGHNLNSAFRTHPPLDDRIARLKALIE